MKKIELHYFDYYVLLFFCVSFMGWLWETLLCLIENHDFVNRGIYYGPYLPIYGIGGLTLMLMLNSLRKRPVTVFFLSASICTALEYAAASWLEYKWKAKWWDYSGYFMNIDGKICLLCTVGFGLGGALLICVFQPIFNKLYHKMTLKLRLIICIILLALFLADAAYSGIKPNSGKNITCISAPDILKYFYMNYK